MFTLHVCLQIKKCLVTFPILQYGNYVKITIILKKFSNYTHVPNIDLETVSTNSFGFRGGEIFKDKPQNVYRIFMVGGSTTFGSAVFDNMTISHQLQKKFENIDSQYNVEVINAGVSGSFSLPETKLVKNKIIEFKPDMIIVYDGWNELRTSEKQYYSEIQFKSSDHVLRSFLDIFESKNLIILKKIEKELKEENPKIFQQKFDINIAEKRSIIWKERWLDICKLGESENFSTVIVLQPFVGTGNKVLSQDEMAYYILKNNEKRVNVYEYFAQSLNQLNNSCTKTIDFRNIFDGFDEPLYFDEVHVGDKGNMIIANELFTELEDLIKQEIQKR